MIRLITVPNDNDPELNRCRQRLAPWAATQGWTYLGYNDPADHIAQISLAAAGRPIEVIDCICHGTPTKFDHTDLGRAEAWGRALGQTPGLSSQTHTYLDACNTGLTWAGLGPIAQAVANGSGCTVFGTKGFISTSTSFAEGNEMCERTSGGAHPYPGAQDATGPDVWLPFYPRVAATPLASIDVTTLNLVADNRIHTTLSRLIADIIQNVAVDFPPLRMAPDITIIYPRDSEILIMDVYGNGGLLRDRRSGTTWHVAPIEELQRLLFAAAFS